MRNTNLVKRRLDHLQKKTETLISNINQDDVLKKFTDEELRSMAETSIEKYEELPAYKKYCALMGYKKNDK